MTRLLLGARPRRVLAQWWAGNRSRRRYRWLHTSHHQVLPRCIGPVRRCLHFLFLGFSADLALRACFHPTAPICKYTITLAKAHSIKPLKILKGLLTQNYNYPDCRCSAHIAGSGRPEGSAGEQREQPRRGRGPPTETTPAIIKLFTPHNHLALHTSL